MSDTIPMYAECTRCGERWKAATLPISVNELCAASKVMRCPNCGIGSSGFCFCESVGKHAVVSPRDGRKDWKK